MITVVNGETDIASGASILNVAAAERTPELVRRIRERFPDVPVIATGGPTPETIRATVEAGANAVTFTPPSAKILFSELMSKYRE